MYKYEGKEMLCYSDNEIVGLEMIEIKDEKEKKEFLEKINKVSTTLVNDNVKLSESDEGNLVTKKK